uniref:Uncharacterized protein n=1 Tax=Lepeophtheirus salmonis TaxID=72036 RepID=A0A0K2SXG8_LEPSM
MTQFIFSTLQINKLIFCLFRLAPDGKMCNILTNSLFQILGKGTEPNIKYAPGLQT